MSASWSHDGSLEAYLCLVAEGITGPERPLSVENRGLGQGSLLAMAAERSFQSPPGAEVDAAAAFLVSLSRRLYAATLRAWMSEESIEGAIIDVGIDCRERGEGQALADYGRPSLSRLAEAVRRVNKEIHLLEGLARFTPRRDGTWISLLEPRHNVLPALAPYFLGRFGAESFVIVDLGRRYALAAVREGARTKLEALGPDSFKELVPESMEDEDAELWRRYFRVIENEGRHNPSLQRRLMPLRYWAQLTELQEQPSA